jgi:hypothetical protein
MRIRKPLKHTDPTDPDADPLHCNKLYLPVVAGSKSAEPLLSRRVPYGQLHLVPLDVHYLKKQSMILHHQPNFSISGPESKRFLTRIRIKEFKYF